MAISKVTNQNETAMKKQEVQIKFNDWDLETLFLVVYYYVDELCKPWQKMLHRPGTKPDFSDSEVICLKIVEQMLSGSEKAWHSFVRKNYLHLFPRLISRSRYHRRGKDLQLFLEHFRWQLVSLLGQHTEYWHILDSMPLPVCHYARAKHNARFCQEFDICEDLLFGRCSSKKERVFGFKLHVMATTYGIPVHYVLAPARHNDSVVAPEVIMTYRGGIGVATDKGYTGLKEKIPASAAIELIIPPKKSQHYELTAFGKWIQAKYRFLIETTFSILSQQFNLQKTGAKSRWGLQARIITKLTSMTFAAYLNFLCGRPLLNIKELIF